MAKKEKTKTPAEETPRETTKPKGRRQKKELLAQQVAYEQQLIKEGKIPARDKYVPRTFFWRIFAICLAFLFGIIAALGGIVVAGVVLLNGPTRNLFSKLDIDGSIYLREEYLEKSVFDIYDDIKPDLEALGDPAQITIGRFAKYTPLIDGYIDTIVTQLSDLGIVLSRDTLYEQPVTGLLGYVKDTILTTEVGPLFDKLFEEPDGMVSSLLDSLSTFTEEDGTTRPATLNDIVANGGSMMSDALDTIYLADVIETDDPIMTSLFYTTDENGVEQKTSLGQFASDAQGLINDLSISVLLDISLEDDPAMRYLAFGPELKKDEEGNYIDITLPENIKTVSVKGSDGQPIPEKEYKQYDGGGRYKVVATETGNTIEWLPDPNDETGETYYTEKKVRDLTDDDKDILGDATIGDLVSVDSDSGFLYAVRDWTIDDLQDQDRIKSELSVNDVFEVGESDSKLMNAIKNWKLGDLANETRIERLKIGQIIDANGDSKLIAAMQDWRINELNSQDKIDSLLLGDVLDIGEGAPAMLLALKDKTLGEVSASIDELTLEEALGKETFEGENASKILKALRYTKINELGDAVDGLTVYDVFGDDVYSFTESYDPAERPTRLEGTATEFYYRTDDGEKTALTAGWYTSSEETYTLVPDDAVVAESYIEKKITVYRSPVYYEVDYTGSSTERRQYTGGDVHEDDPYSDYYINEEGERIDLDTEYVYYLNAELDGEPVDSSLRIREEKDESGAVTGYYYIENVGVTRRYADADGKSYAESEVTKGYKIEDKVVVAYFSGAWYLLLGNAEKGIDTPVTELGDLVSGVTTKVNELPLNEMYIHEIVDENPSQDITTLVATLNLPDLKDKKDLGELTVNEVIKLIKAIAEKES